MDVSILIISAICFLLSLACLIHSWWIRQLREEAKNNINRAFEIIAENGEDIKKLFYQLKKLKDKEEDKKDE